MKVSEGMKILAEKWIQKPKGFRVKYQKRANSELVTEYSPGQENNPLDSDVTTWRYAKKLYMATQSDSDKLAEGEFINISVVDENDNPVQYYVTGKNEIFNPKEPLPRNQ